MIAARWTLAVWLLLAAALPALVAWRTPAPVTPPMADLRLAPPGWRAGPGALTPVQRFFVLEKDGRPFLDEMLLKTFHDGRGGRIEAQLFYHRTRRNNAWGDFSDMVNCWHGRFRRVETRTVSLDDDAPATLMTMRRDDESAVVLYWMQSSGRTSANGWRHVAWQYAQALGMRRNDACFVKLSYSGPLTPERVRGLVDAGRHVHRRVDRWLAGGAGADDGAGGMQEPDDGAPHG